MIRLFIACPKFHLEHVFKVTLIIESFHICNFESDTNCQLWFGRFFVMSVDTPIEELPNMGQPDRFDLCQGHSINRCYQWHSP